jgi:hypothetical protein
VSNTTYAEPMPLLPAEEAELRAPRERGHLYRFPFPLRDYLDVSLALPRDLTVAEAERLAAYIRTLAQP